MRAAPGTALMPPEWHGFAKFSRCRRYRYALGRVWDAAGPVLVWVMLNPSTADSDSNDATIARCMARGQALGFGAIRVVNLFAFRATHPADLRAAPDPVGPGNDRAIRAALTGAGAVICAWGVHGAHLGRGPLVLHRLRRAGVPLWHLGLTAAGHPRHPLYIPAAQAPVGFDPDGA